MPLQIDSEYLSGLIQSNLIIYLRVYILSGVRLVQFICAACTNTHKHISAMTMTTLHWLYYVCTEIFMCVCVCMKQQHCSTEF